MVSLKSGWTSRTREACGGGGGGVAGKGAGAQPPPRVVRERQGEVDVGREAVGALDPVEGGVGRIDEITEIQGAALTGVAGLGGGRGEEEPARLLHQIGR